MLEILVKNSKEYRITGSSESLDALGDMLKSSAKLKQKFYGTLVGHGQTIEIKCTDRTDVYQTGQIPEHGDIVKHGAFVFECIGFTEDGNRLGLKSAAGVHYVDDVSTVSLIHRPRPK